MWLGVALLEDVPHALLGMLLFRHKTDKPASLKHFRFIVAL